MTVIADTRFLIVFTFPSTEQEKGNIRELMHRALRERLIIPTVVIAEYIRTTGRKIGKESATTRIADLKESGAEIASLDEEIALRAGELLLRHGDKPMGDAIIAATALIKGASHVVSDDPHFKELGLKTRWTGK